MSNYQQWNNEKFQNEQSLQAIPEQQQQIRGAVATQFSGLSSPVYLPQQQMIKQSQVNPIYQANNQDYFNQEPILISELLKQRQDLFFSSVCKYFMIWQTIIIVMEIFLLFQNWFKLMFSDLYRWELYISFYIFGSIVLITIIILSLIKQIRDTPFDQIVYFIVVILTSLVGSAFTSSFRLKTQYDNSAWITIFIAFFIIIGQIMMIGYTWLLFVILKSEKPFQKYFIMSGIIFLLTTLLAILIEVLLAAGIYIGIILVVGVFLYGLLFICSAQQIKNGKYQLKENQVYISPILIVSNMFMLCIPY